MEIELTGYEQCMIMASLLSNTNNISVVYLVSKHAHLHYLILLYT